MRDEDKIKETAGKDEDKDEEEKRNKTSITRAASLTRVDEERKEKQEQKENDKTTNERGGINEWIDHDELYKDRIHLDETVPVTQEQKP